MKHTTSLFFYVEQSDAGKQGLLHLQKTVFKNENFKITTSPDQHA